MWNAYYYDADGSEKNVELQYKFQAFLRSFFGAVSLRDCETGTGGQVGENLLKSIVPAHTKVSELLSR